VAKMPEKGPVSSAGGDPPRTRQVRATYETGTSHVRAPGWIRPSESPVLMSPGRGGWGKLRPTERGFGFDLCRSEAYKKALL
jgi:hypothetical protein